IRAAELPHQGPGQNPGLCLFVGTLRPMDPSGATLPAIPTNPDWSTLTGEFVCPLCEYNLRGLTNPRCPECGYAFDWPDVLEADRRRHPYLFEHYPRRNLWSFFRTLRGSLLPSGFWEKLKATHAINPRRLFIYW